MRCDFVERLQQGDEVYWNDPDGGKCSDTYIIQKIWVEDEGWTIFIVDINGRELHCFANEIE